MAKSKKSFFRSSSLLFFFASSFSAFSQNPSAVHWEPQFSINLSSESPWSYSFGLTDRSLISAKAEGERVSNFTTQHLELNQSTHYQSNKNTVWSLGIRYRFRELFDSGRSDELRFSERIKYKQPFTFFSISHRGTLEQRFLKSRNVWRFRYQFSASKPLSSIFSIGASAESLYSLILNSRPLWEQRFGLNLGNSFFKNLDLKLGLDYRMINFTQHPKRDLYLITGASLKL